MTTGSPLPTGDLPARLDLSFGPEGGKFNIVNIRNSFTTVKGGVFKMCGWLGLSAFPHHLLGQDWHLAEHPLAQVTSRHFQGILLLNPSRKLNTAFPSPAVRETSMPGAVREPKRADSWDCLRFQVQATRKGYVAACSETDRRQDLVYSLLSP